ncbi:MAG: DUF5696 domain-containing protein [Tepidisphaerales bacterium]
MTAPVLVVRGDHLAAELHADGVIRLTNLAAGHRWETWPVAIQEDNDVDVGHVWLRTTRSLCEQYPAHFSAERLVDGGLGGGLARLTVYGREARTVGRFTVELKLHIDALGEALEVSIDDIDPALPSLSYPAGLRHVDELLLPQGVGRRVRSPGDEQRRLYSFWSHLNLRMWGALSRCGGADDASPDAGVLVEFARGHEDAMLLVTKTYAAPVWLRSLGRWAHGPEARRTLRYRFTRGGHVGLARTYRRVMDARTPPVTLAEKRERFPQLTSLLGGRHVSFMLGHTVRHRRELEVLREPSGPEGLRVAMTYADVRRALDELHAAGMTRALVMLRGWIRGGYDESHPDIWPPDEAFGTLDELRDLCRGVRLPAGFTVALHDNYQDMYLQSPSFPQGVVRDRDGHAMPGGYWAGGQAYILSGRAGLNYLQRNWAQLRTLSPRALFPDTITAVQLYQSFDPAARQTRAEDESAKLAQLRFIAEQGVAVGSEEAAEFGLPYVGWLENRHRRIAGETVPLWPLVTHDLVANGRYGNAFCTPAAMPSSTHAESGAAPPWTVELLWGYFALMSLGTRGGPWGGPWGDSPESLIRAYRDTRHIDPHFARVATLPMTDHRLLTAHGQVEQTVFGDHIAVTVNFSSEPFQSGADGLSLPPGGYHIDG